MFFFDLNSCRSVNGGDVHDNSFGVVHGNLVGAVVHKNSCHSHEAEFREGKKLLSTRTRSGVWRPLEGPFPVVDKLALGHRRESEEVHVETREGRTSTTRCGTRLVELGQGCEVVVKIPSDPERDFMPHGPGSSLRERWGWKPLLRTLTSGIWVLRGALQSVGFLDALASAGGWAGRSTYRTAWAVPICEVANAGARTGTAQLSGHVLGGRLFGCCPVCGGLSHP